MDGVGLGCRRPVALADSVLHLGWVSLGHNSCRGLRK